MGEQNISWRLPISICSRISWRIDCGAYDPVHVNLLVIQVDFDLRCIIDFSI